VRALQGTRMTNAHFLLQHHKQNGANSTDGIEYRINGEFST